MNFMLFLICTFLAIQGYEARSTELQPRNIDDIINTIKNFIKKVDDVLAEVFFDVTSIIEKLKDKIFDFINRIPDIVNEIKEKIYDLIILTGETGKQCLDNERENITLLQNFARSELKQCVKDAEKSTELLKTKIKILLDKANKLQKDAKDHIVKCITDNKWNLSNLIDCVHEQVEPVTEELKTLKEDFEKTIIIAKEITKNTVKSLFVCTRNVQQVISEWEEKIIDSIKECIIESS